MWARKPGQAPSGEAPGMGVRFDKLDGPSQEVLARILAEQRLRDGPVLESLYETGMRTARLALKGSVGRARVRTTTDKLGSRK